MAIDKTSIDKTIDKALLVKTTAGLIPSLLAALRADGKDPDNLRPDDLMAVDQFHIRGKQATIELANLLAKELKPQSVILDLGAGLGGSARYLAGRFEGAVIGLELDPDYVAAAELLTERLGLKSQVHFAIGDATAIPLSDQSVDAVWIQHLSMAIENKAQLFAEIYRVLKPGATLVLQEIVAGSGGATLYPVPWASTPEQSFLSSPAELLAQLEQQGLGLLESQDMSPEALHWFERQTQPRSQPKPHSLRLSLLLGDSFATMMQNQRRNLSEQRIGLMQLIATRPVNQLQSD